MCYKATADMWKLRAGLSAGQKLVLAYLCDSKNHKTGVCCPGLERIAADCEMSKRGVSKAITVLKRKQIIEKTYDKGKSVHYSIDLTVEQGSTRVEQGSTLTVEQGSMEQGSTRVEQGSKKRNEVPPNKKEQENNKKLPTPLSSDDDEASKEIYSADDWSLAKAQEPEEQNPPAQKGESFASKSRRIIETWNEMVAEEKWLKKVISLPSHRVDKLKTRLGEEHFDWDKILEEVKCFKDFHKYPQDRKEAWLSFDWIIKNDSHYIKILEGKYRAADKAPGVEYYEDALGTMRPVKSDGEKPKSNKPAQINYSEDFERLWKSYPSSSRGSKMEAFKEFKKLKPTSGEVDHWIEWVKIKIVIKEIAVNSEKFHPDFKNLNGYLRKGDCDTEPAGFGYQPGYIVKESPTSDKKIFVRPEGLKPNAHQTPYQGATMMDKHRKKQAEEAAKQAKDDAELEGF